MGKTLLYVLILALVVFGIYFFIIRKADNPYSNSEAGFNIKDTGAIGKMYLVSNDGEAITAERKDNTWILNGKYKALPSMVGLILNTVYYQVPTYPVTKVAYDNAVKVLSTEGIKVELYNREGKKMSIYYVGGPGVNGNGTNMLMEGAKDPYLVQIPGFTGDLRARYSTRFTDWRDRTVFNIPAAAIKSVSVQYVAKPINSFIISREGATFSLKGDTVITGSQGALNDNRIKLYMNYFANVNCEGYMNGIPGMDSTIKTTVKRSVIDIETVQGQKQHADIYWMPLNRRSKNKLTADDEVPDDYDADRMYAVINNNADTVLIQTFIFRKILRSSFEFYQRDEVRKGPVYERPKNVLIHH